MDKVKMRDGHPRSRLSACFSHSYTRFVTPTGPCLCFLFCMDGQALQRHTDVGPRCSGEAQWARSNETTEPPPARSSLQPKIALARMPRSSGRHPQRGDARGSATGLRLQAAAAFGQETCRMELSVE